LGNGAAPPEVFRRRRSSRETRKSGTSNSQKKWGQ
jgi:hypothetical protein